MTNSTYFVKSTTLRVSLDLFNILQIFTSVNLYFSMQGVSSKSYLLPTFISPLLVASISVLFLQNDGMVFGIF